MRTSAVNLVGTLSGHIYEIFSCLSQIYIFGILRLMVSKVHTKYKKGILVLMAIEW